MYKIFFYKNRNGKSPLLDYMRKLASKRDKDSRIKSDKIDDYIEYLAKEGNKAREPYAKRLAGEIWELRPLRDRILYAAWDGQSFILLHYFTKKTQKTPSGEIEQAKRNLADYKLRKTQERKKDDE